MGEYITYYCGNNNKNLKLIVNHLLLTNFSWIQPKEYDDFYSIAGQIVWYCEEHFSVSNNIKFETFLNSCLTKKFKSRITYYNRKKRKVIDLHGNFLREISIDSLTEGEVKIEFEDTFQKINLLDETWEVTSNIDENICEYLSKLTKRQKQIAEMIMQDYTPSEIKEILGLSNKEYKEQWKKMTSLRKTEVLCRGR